MGLGERFVLLSLLDQSLNVGDVGTHWLLLLFLIGGNAFNKREFIDFDVNGPEDSCFKYRRVNLPEQKSTTKI